MTGDAIPNDTDPPIPSAADLATHDPAGRARLVAALDPLGIDYELFACDPAMADTTAFCAAYGFAPEDSANTILVIGKGSPPRYAACVVLAPNRLDVNRTVRDRLGTRKASFAPAESTREITGMEIGGVTVFGLPADLSIWIDARVMGRERVVVGGGSRSWKVILRPADLLRIPGTCVVDGLASDPAAQPATDPAAQPATEPATQPAAGPSGDPDPDAPGASPAA